MMSNVAESFWDWCHFNCISRVFEITYSHFSISGFLTNFRYFQVFVFGYRAQNENPEITENLYFLVYNTPMHVDLCFDYYFNCSSVNTGISKNVLNLIYRGVKSFQNANSCCMINSLVESFWDWCCLNSISTVFRATFSYFSIMTFL